MLYIHSTPCSKIYQFWLVHKYCSFIMVICENFYFFDFSQNFESQRQLKIFSDRHPLQNYLRTSQNWKSSLHCILAKLSYSKEPLLVKIQTKIFTKILYLNFVRFSRFFYYEKLWMLFTAFPAQTFLLSSLQQHRHHLQNNKTSYIIVLKGLTVLHYYVKHY